MPALGRRVRQAPRDASASVMARRARFTVESGQHRARGQIDLERPELERRLAEPPELLAKRLDGRRAGARCSTGASPTTRTRAPRSVARFEHRPLAEGAARRGRRAAPGVGARSVAMACLSRAGSLVFHTRAPVRSASSTPRSGPSHTSTSRPSPVRSTSTPPSKIAQTRPPTSGRPSTSRPSPRAMRAAVCSATHRFPATVRTPRDDPARRPRWSHERPSTRR